MSDKDDVYVDALAFVGHMLTQAQRRALVSALVRDPDGAQPEITAGEHTIHALKATRPALVDQEGMRRFLTPLGREVARYLNSEGNYDIPRMDNLVPVIGQGFNIAI